MSLVPLQCVAVAVARPAIHVFVGSKEVVYKEARPVWRGSRMLVPLRETVEAMGGQAGRGPIGRRVYAVLGDRRVELALDGTPSRVNGLPRRIRNRPWVSQGRVVVPPRFFSEALSVLVAMDPRRGTVRLILRPRR